MLLSTVAMQASVRDALIGFMAATAQAEANKEAQRAGIEANKGDPAKCRGGKPSYDRDKFNSVLDRLGSGENVSSIARNEGLTRQTVLRIRDNQEQAEASLTRWLM